MLGPDDREIIKGITKLTNYNHASTGTGTKIADVFKHNYSPTKRCERVFYAQGTVESSDHDDMFQTVRKEPHLLCERRLWNDLLHKSILFHSTI